MKRLLLALLLLPTLAYADYASVVLADNPAHYFHLGDTSGTTAVDSQTNTQSPPWGALNGTYNGAYTLNQSGIAGYSTNAAVSLSGTDSTGGYVDLGTTGDYNVWLGPAGTFGTQLEFWMYPTDIGTRAQILFDNSSSVGPAYNWRVSCCGAAGGIINYQLLQCSGADYGAILAVGSLTLNAWNYVTVNQIQNDGTMTSMTVWVNNIQVGQKTSGWTGTLCNGTFPASVGRKADVGTGRFAGKIDELAWYKVTGDSDGFPGSQLTNARRTAHYNAGVGIQSNGLNAFSVSAPALPHFPHSDLLLRFIQDKAYQTGGFRALNNRSVLSPTPISFGPQFPLRNYLGR